jgi:hypothetical protein
MYFVHWTIAGIADHPPNFDFILGEWGDGTSPKDRVVGSLDYKLLGTGPAFRVIDATPRQPQYESLAVSALRREDILASHYAAHIFTLADTVLANDARLAELLGGWTITAP